MSKKYATIGNEVRYQEEEISYEDSWKNSSLFKKRNKKSRSEAGQRTIVEFVGDVIGEIFFALLEGLLG